MGGKIGNFSVFLCLLVVFQVSSNSWEGEGRGGGGGGGGEEEVVEVVEEEEKEKGRWWDLSFFFSLFSLNLPHASSSASKTSNLSECLSYNLL